MRSAVRKKRLVILLSGAVLAAALAITTVRTNQGCRLRLRSLLGASAARAHLADVPIPRQADWTDYGVVLPSGLEGNWDDGLGAAPAMSSVIKKDGRFFLYYVGFDGLRASDQGERNRSIGVATSPDGIHFTKHSGNPIITYRPNNNEEETAGGVAASVNASGDVVLYWGAADAGSPTSTLVDSDVRVSLSSDGIIFTDLGDVLRHNNPAIWGYGDELFPLGVFHDGTNWYLYYIAKGLFGVYWDVGVSQGTSADKIGTTRCVIDEDTSVFGGGSLVEIEPDRLAFFIIRNHDDPYMEVRAVSTQAMHQLSEPIDTYRFENLRTASVLLDQERSTWFMYYLATGYDYFERPIRLKLAPAGEPDTTPPNPPAVLAATVASESEVALTWEAAHDPDTGVVGYNIYRDGEKVGRVLDLEYHDSDPLASIGAKYQVSAINFHGVEGRLSDPISIAGPDA